MILTPPPLRTLTRSFLEVGTYTLAFTCDGAMDTPDGEETLSFSPTVNVTVNANQTTTLNF